jgi:hypothetical protein
MALASNSRIQHKSQILSKLGSFWASVFRDKDKAQAIIALAQVSGSVRDLLSRIHSLAGLHDAGRLKHAVTFTFSPADLIKTGEAFYDDASPLKYTETFGEGVVYGHFRVQNFALPLKHITPLIIQALDRRLVLGGRLFRSRRPLPDFQAGPNNTVPGLQHPGCYRSGPRLPIYFQLPDQRQSH